MSCESTNIMAQPLPPQMGVLATSGSGVSNPVMAISPTISPTIYIILATAKHRWKFQKKKKAKGGVSVSDSNNSRNV